MSRLIKTLYYLEPVVLVLRMQQVYADPSTLPHLFSAQICVSFGHSSPEVNLIVRKLGPEGVNVSNLE